ncbi:MAG: hypothetical protein WCO63_07680 [Bacteroidota bacterium]
MKSFKSFASFTFAVKLFISAFFVMMLITVQLRAQSGNNIEVSATAGTMGPSTYTTLGAAFAKINDGTHQGVITIKVNASTSESSSAVLYASGTSGSSYESVNISPSVGGLSISGSMGSPLIDLNGAQNVTIDGQVNGTGGNISLVIINTSASGGSTAAIRFINNATNNTIEYCKIQASNNASNGAILIFSTTASGSTGNNSNIIDHNEITGAGTNRPLNVIYSIGSSTASNILNTISNNNIYNFLNPNNSSCGILLAEAVDTKGYNSDWTITGNSFYETTTFQPAGGSYNIIYINTQNNGTPYGDNFTISYNYIGGSGPGCTGTFTKSSSTNYFWGIQLHVGTARASNIQGNTISNINYSNVGGADWWGIYIDWGAVNMGTTAPNYIGAGSDGGSISYTCSSNNGRFLAIHLQGDGNCYVQNNVISAITLNNTNSAYATNFWGIHQQARANINVISDNTIGSATIANSIQSLSAATDVSSAQTVIGYSGDGNGGTMTLSNNIIANLTNGTTNANVDTKGKVYGIWAYASGTYTISRNSIHDLTIANANSQTGPIPGQSDNTTLSAGGILFSGSSNFSHTISGNTVYNISNSSANFQGHVAGLYFYGQTTASSVSRNLVYGMGANTGSGAANTYGIKIGGGVATYSNNIITLGGNNTTNIYGIYEPGTSGTTSNIYFNTVYLSGSPGSGSLNSYCLYSASNSSIRNFRNNVFVNARTNNGSTGKHFAAYLAFDGNSSFTMDYNDYLASGSGGMLGYHKSGTYSASNDISSLSAWKTATAQDAHSFNTDPAFTNPTPGNTAADYLPTMPSLIAATGTGITTDYDGGPDRSLTLPSMGAFEYTVSTCANPSSGGTIASEQTICTGSVPAAFTSSAVPSGQTGTLEYKWQYSTTSSSLGFADIASSTSTTHTPGTLSVTTWFKRLSTVTCNESWPAAAASNVLQITVNPSSYSGGSWPTVASLQASGTGLKWYLEGADVTPLSSSTTLIDGHTYYASQTMNGCESAARFTVVGNVDMTPCAPTADSPQTPGAGARVSNLTTLTGTNIRWYLTASGGTALEPTTSLSSGTNTYYATQKIDCTESATRLAITVTIP